ncbi:MAG: hypothetical protein NC203_06025 [Firmicutes bacterium]|nr:hypothetical protein [[Eubacterium] siraeum]MCM1487908.1 hypothetical protein [Bacillota bacterium]
MEKEGILNRIHGRVGHKGIMFLLYLSFFAVHTIISVSVYLPSIDPNEFSAAALANMLLGGDWTAAMSKSDYYYGFLQSFLYVPALLVSRDPYVQYHIMVIINGLIMSFIPVIVYSCALTAGVKKPWQALTAAVCTGGWMTLLVHSKFIWNETAAVFLPFLALYILLRADKAERKASKRFLSVLLGMVCGISYCAHQRLFAMILAVTVTVVLSRLLLKRKSVELPMFFFSLALFLTGAVFSNYLVQMSLWQTADPTKLQNTAESFFAGLPSALADGGWKNLFICLLSQLYYFVCSSWGLGALGMSVLVSYIAYYVSSHKRKGVHTQADPPIGGQVTAILLFYTVFLTVFMLFISVCYRFSAENLAESQSALLFGRYLDGVIPFTVMFILIYVYTEDLTLPRILGGVISSAAVYVCFFAVGRSTVLKAETAAISPILGLYPAMFGESTSSAVTSTGLIAAVSASLCVMAVFIVIVSCAKKLKKAVISGVLIAISCYGALFGLLYYLPLSAEQSQMRNAEYIELSKYIFNSSEAPSVTAYRCGRNCVMMMQYLNQNITVKTADNPQALTDDTYIILPSDVPLRFDGQQGRIVFSQLGETENYKVYAYGERAKAYAQAQSGSEPPPSETAPEKTSEPAEPPQAPPQTAAAASSAAETSSPAETSPEEAR